MNDGLFDDDFNFSNDFFPVSLDKMGLLDKYFLLDFSDNLFLLNEGKLLDYFSDFFDWDNLISSFDNVNFFFFDICYVFRYLFLQVDDLFIGNDMGNVPLNFNVLDLLKYFLHLNLHLFNLLDCFVEINWLFNESLHFVELRCLGFDYFLCVDSLWHFDYCLDYSLHFD
jgi:hypothetical protein